MSVGDLHPQKELTQKESTMTSIDQQLTDLSTDLQRELAALYAEHLERLDKLTKVAGCETDGFSQPDGFSSGILWGVYKAKRNAAGAVYDAAHAALFSRRSRAK